MKQSILIKIISIFMLAAMVLGVTACAGTETKKSEDTTEAQEETERQWLDSLDDVNYEGKELIILAYDTTVWIADDNAETKEVVEAAKVRETQNVAARFNVKITPHAWDGEEGIKGVMQRCVSSDLHEFDYVSGDGLAVAPLAMEGYVINLAATDEFDKVIDLSAPWWSEAYTDALNVEDMIYWINGYTWSGEIHQVYCVFFNLNLAKLIAGETEDGKAYSFYDTVREGKWTVDEMYKYIRQSYKDDGNGERDENDRYGFGMQSDTFIDKVAMCAGATYTKRDTDNIPVADIATDRNISLNEKLYDLVHEDAFSNNGGFNAKGIFRNENSLFYCDNLDCCIGFRDLEWDYGVLPMPKYDENQENYLNTFHYRCPVDGIIANASEDDYEFILTIAEAISAETYRVVRPAWLDAGLKNKYSRDEDTKEMIDLTQGNTTTDFLIVYGGASGYETFFNSAYNTRDISSTIARKTKPVGKLIDGLIAKLEGLADR